LKKIIFIIFLFLICTKTYSQSSQLESDTLQLRLITSWKIPDSLRIYDARNPFAPPQPKYLKIPFSTNVTITLHHHDNELRTIFNSYLEAGCYAFYPERLNFLTYYPTGTYFIRVRTEYGTDELKINNFDIPK